MKKSKMEGGRRERKREGESSLADQYMCMGNSERSSTHHGQFEMYTTMSNHSSTAQSLCLYV